MITEIQKRFKMRKDNPVGMVGMHAQISLILY